MNRRELIVICVVLLFACIILYVTYRRIKYQLNHSQNFPGSADNKVNAKEDIIIQKMKAFTSDDWISLYGTVFDSNGHQIKLTSEHIVATDNENTSDDSRNEIGGVGDTDDAAAEEDKEKEEEKTFVIIDIETGNCNNVKKSSTKNESDIITEDEEETETETNSATIDTHIEIDTVFGTTSSTSSSSSDSYNIRNSTHHRKEEGKVNAAVDKEDSNQQQTIDDDDAAVGTDNDDDFDDSYNTNNTTRILPLVSSSIFPILSSCKGTKCVICLESFQIGDDVVWSSEEEEQQKQQQQQQQHNTDTSNNNTYESYNININNNYYCNHLFHKECMVHFLASNGKRRIMSNKPMVMIYNNNSSTDSDCINPCPTCRRNFCSITPNDCIVAAIAQ